jgi:hypothetical protein
MYRAFPCSAYYEISVTISDIQEPHRPMAIYRRSDFGNPV